MSYVAGPSDATSHELERIYGAVHDELRQVEKRLCSESLSSDHSVRRLLRYGLQMGGKRLRPALMLLAAKAVGQVDEAHLVLATAVEMIHTATLVHDDVLDEATVRRHAATVNARWNNETSVLLGDLLFTHAFYLASTLGSTHACRTIGRATNAVCEGEIRQTQTRGNFRLSEEQYLQIIEAKTGQLCACCCQLGARYAGADGDTEERMRQFGLKLGIAFQIADDLLDLVGDEQTVGKSLGTDLSKQKATLPLIHALRQMPAQARSQAITRLEASGHGQPAALAGWLAQYGGIRYARQQAQAFAEQARDCLEPLPWSPARDALEGLSRFVIDRHR